MCKAHKATRQQRSSGHWAGLLLGAKRALKAMSELTPLISFTKSQVFNTPHPGFSDPALVGEPSLAQGSILVVRALAMEGHYSSLHSSVVYICLYFRTSNQKDPLDSNLYGNKEFKTLSPTSFANKKGHQHKLRLGESSKG